MITLRRFSKSYEAISIQTSDFWGTAPYQNISNISVINAEIYGDDNAADGIDITSDNADNMIQDVYVSAYIEGCKRGFAVSTGSNSYNFSNINLDLIINGTDETIGSFLRVKNSSLKVKAQYATAEGISIQQINNTKIANSFYHPTQSSTFDNAIIVQPPSELDVDVLDTIKVFINGVKYSKNYYTLDYLSVPNTIKVTFNTGLLGLSVEYEDEVYLAGKFLLL